MRLTQRRKDRAKRSFWFLVAVFLWYRAREIHLHGGGIFRESVDGKDNPLPGGFHPVNEDLFTGTPGFHPVNEDLFTGTPVLAKGLGNGSPVMPLTKCGTALARNAPAKRTAR